MYYVSEAGRPYLTAAISRASELKVSAIVADKANTLHSARPPAGTITSGVIYRSITATISNPS